MKFRVSKYFLISFGAFCLLPSYVFAQCASPAGVAGEMGYNVTGTGAMEYCNGTSWIDMGAELFSGGGSNSNTVFATSTLQNGNLGGVSGADAICAARASAAGLSGTFKAWISTTSYSDDPIVTFMQSAVPYKLVDGTTVASDWSDLIDGTLSNAINLDESGNAATGYAWTFVGSNAQSGGSDNCSSWTDSSGASDGEIGSVTATNSTWTASFGDLCSETYRLYCFQQDGGGGSSDPIAHWKLDETSGTSIADSSGNGNTGTFSGETAVVSTTGKVSTGLTFDGVDDYVNFGDVLNSLTLPITITSWVYLNDTSDAPIFFTDDANATAGDVCGAWIAVEGSKIEAGVGVCSCNHVGCRKIATTTSTVSTDKWMHVTAVFNDYNDRDIYIDGVLQTIGWEGSGTSFAQNSFSARMGRSLRKAEYANAVIDDVRVYDRALSDAEISKIAICSKPGELGYNFPLHVLQWCDDTLDAYNAGTVGAGGAGCAASGSKTAGVEGSVQYDSANNKMVFCDGSNWVDIPN